MKLSDLSPDDVEVEQAAPAKLKLSSLDPSDYTHEPEAEPEKPGIVSRALERVSAYTDAPARSAVMAAISGKNPLSAFGKQSGAPAETAPTGTDIAAKVGASQKPFVDQNVDLPEYPEFGSELPISANLYKNISPAQVLGAGIDLVADPKNLLPYAGPAIKGVSEAFGVGEKAANAVSKLGHAFTGVPAQDVKTYIKEGRAVKDLIARSGGDVPGLADAVRDDWASKIQGFKKIQNDAITAAKAPESAAIKSVPPQPILDALDAAKAKINPTLEPEKIRAIDGIKDKIKTLGDNGGLSLRDLDDVRGFLQDRGGSAYVSDGQLFNQAPEVAKAAKSGGAVTRQELNKIAPDSMKEGYSNLSKLHDIDDDLNQNLLSSGRPDSALFSAGSGSNPRNAKALGELGDLIGHDTAGDLRRLGAARTFANPPLLPMDTTGKSVLRTGLGVAAGKVAAHAIGIPGTVGEILGGAMTSPAALKLAIDTGRIPAELAQASFRALGPFADPIMKAAARGPQALEVMHKILSSDPEYLMQLKYAPGVPPSGRDPAETDQ